MMEPLTEAEFVNVTQREAVQRFGDAGQRRVLVALFNDTPDAQLLARLIAAVNGYTTLADRHPEDVVHRLGKLARASEAHGAATTPDLSDDDIDQIIEGIEHFIMDGDSEVAAIWQPYVDKLAALRASGRPHETTK